VSEKSSDLEILFPGMDVKAGGETVTVKPFKFGQLAKAVKLLRPITDAVRDTGIAGMNGSGFVLAADWPLRLPELMADGGEPLLEFVAFAVAKPREWLDTLDADEGVELTKTVFEVNSSFFVSRIAPKLGLAVQVSPETSAETGAPSSPV
jgi:hypothetical protein